MAASVDPELCTRILCVVAENPSAFSSALVAVIISFVSLLLSVTIFFSGTRAERTSRRKDICRATFDATLWPPVQAALSVVDEIHRDAAALCQTDVNSPEFQSRITDLHKRQSEAFERLIASLEEIDESSMTKKNDWASIAQKEEEHLINLLARATYGNFTEEERATELRKLSVALKDLSSSVQRRRERQLEEFV